MKTLIRTLLSGASLAAALFGVTSYAAETTIDVYKSPTCGCCTKWIDHLRANGFTVRALDVSNNDAARKGAGIPAALGSCHTALVNGYAIEGHVPAQDIKRLLKERPKAIGLTVPGMPMGSPGMEGPRSEPYNVLLIDQQGGTTVYSRHVPSGPGDSVLKLKPRNGS